MPNLLFKRSIFELVGLFLLGDLILMINAESVRIA